MNTYSIKEKKEVYSIQYARGFAALFVFFSHYKDTINNSLTINGRGLGDFLFMNGGFGVDLFFVISGFVILMSTEKSSSRGMNCMDFLIKRFFRIYPLLIVTVLTIGFLRGYDMHRILISIIPLHLNYASMAPYFNYNVLYVAWTITYELIFYAVFLLAMAINHKYRGLICILLLSIMFSAIRVYTGDGITFDTKNNIDISQLVFFTPIASVLSSPLILNFILGMLSYTFYKLLVNDFNKSSYLKIPMILLISICILFLFSDSVLKGHGPLKWGGVSFILITTITLYEDFFGIQKRKGWLFLGDISYSLYMVHPIVLWIMATYPMSYFGLTQIPKFIFGTIIVISVSSISYFVIERSFSKLARHLLRKHVNKKQDNENFANTSFSV
ncbi:acyltransferase family protein [Escherichia fergusonii]|uniref:acyltransferase family protein n=1 Tax=Escherichia fergusonii TaxID=564 RepID=UPI0015EA4352|nr:acyltransferase [Escherichia fergusonii]QMC73378.1 acyltransferase [Escherichia fergusonii]